MWIWIRILLFTSVRFRIRFQGAKPLRIHADFPVLMIILCVVIAAGLD